MFDIGFMELSLIGVVLLLVVGPERMPKVARTAGHWFGKARYFVTSMKADIDREIKAEDLQRMMKEQADSSGLHEIYDETSTALDEAALDENLEILDGDEIADTLADISSKSDDKSGNSPETKEPTSEESSAK